MKLPLALAIILVACGGVYKQVQFGESLDKCILDAPTRQAADACRCDAGDSTKCPGDAGSLDAGREGGQ